MVKKGGKLPPGHINDWFWEDKDMKDYMATRLPKGSMSHQSSCIYSSDHLLTHSLTHSLTHPSTHSLTGQKHERYMATCLPVGLMTFVYQYSIPQSVSHKAAEANAANMSLFSGIAYGKKVMFTRTAPLLQSWPLC